MNSIVPRSLDYTDKDFASIRLRLQALVRSVFPTWSDFNVAQFGNVLLELYAFVGDLLTFYQDNQAREARLVTATQRKNVIALAKMLGYAPGGVHAAQAGEVLTLRTPPVAPVTIPAGTQILTANVTAPLAFQLLADVVFAPSQTNATTTVEHSVNATDNFDPSSLPDQAFVLSQTPYLDQSAQVVVGGFVWVEVDNFLASGPADLHFVVTVDQNDRATIRTGNGVNGVIPSSSVAVGYKTGGGVAGNVEPGAINRVQGAFTDSSGNPVTLSATNPQKAQGGIDRQSIAQIQTLAPMSLRANTRSVSKEDFEIHALDVAGVARALMATSNEDPGIEENSGILYVVPTGGGVATDTLRAAVLTSVTVTYPSTLTFRVSVQAAAYLAIDVWLRVYKAKSILGSQVGLNLRTALASYFAIQQPDGTPNPNIDFGANYLDANGKPAPALALAPLFTTLEKVAGVRKLGGSAIDFLLNGAHQDVTLLPRQFPMLGKVTIYDGDSGMAI
jgi:baseplate J-like protein